MAQPPCLILGGDLGGTKTWLALAQAVNGRPQIVREQRYASRDFARFDDILADFLADSPRIQAACLGIAGPTDGRFAKLTYLPWTLDADALAQGFALGQVSLLNDFAATAHGLALVESHETLVLHPGKPSPEAPRVVLGAGTGLGVAGLLPERASYRVVPGEGGHVGFAPQTPEQGELWHWLLQQSGRVTSEDIVSGPGLARIHAFLGGRPQTPAEIGSAALAGKDPVASAALRLWMACYGGFAGDLALLWMARGGVYLAGGMAAKLLPHTDWTPLRDAFLAKREHRHLLDDMPLIAVTAEDLGLRGALARAAQAIPG